MPADDKPTLRSKMAKLPNHKYGSYIGQLKLCLYECWGVMDDDKLIERCRSAYDEVKDGANRPRLGERDVRASVNKVYALSSGIMRIELKRLMRTNTREEATKIVTDMYVDSAGRFYHVYVNMIRSLSTQVTILDIYSKMLHEATGERRAITVAAARLKEHNKNCSTDIG